MWEKTASLALRYGRTDVIDTYAEHGRVMRETEGIIDAAYTAWRTDTLAGRASVLVTDSNESVRALDERARADLILDGIVNAREVELHDGTRAATGDTVITRRNDRRLRAGRSWVRNGDRWNITEVRDDERLHLRRAGKRWGASVVVPAKYAAEHLDLGYAVTSYRAQGITVDSSHVLADASMTRETFYVAMTRGREENIAYVAVDKPDPAHDGLHPGENTEATARSVLFEMQHVGAELSAHETITAEQDAWGSIAQLAAGEDAGCCRTATRPLGRIVPLVGAQRRRRRRRDRFTRIRRIDRRAPPGRGEPARRRDPTAAPRGSCWGWGTPMTSRPSCTTASPRRPRGRRGPVARGRPALDRRPHPRSHWHSAVRDAAGADRATRPYRDPGRCAPRHRAH